MTLAKVDVREVVGIETKVTMKEMSIMTWESVLERQETKRKGK